MITWHWDELCSNIAEKCLPDTLYIESRVGLDKILSVKILEKGRTEAEQK